MFGRWMPLAGILATAVAVGAAALATADTATVPAALDLLLLPAPGTGHAAGKLLLDVVHSGSRLVAVGEFGLIVVSDDGGKTWTQSSSPTSVMLTATWFNDERTGWAVGHDGVVLATVDGGKRWIRQLDGAAINEQMLKAAQARLEEGKARAGGTEKDRELSEQAEDRLADAVAATEAGPSRPLLGVRFTDARTGFVVGSYGQLMRTDDAGKTWTYIGNRLPNPVGLHLNGIELGKQGEIYIAAEAGVVFRSLDHGQTWTRADLGYNGQLYGVMTTPSVVLAYGFRGHVFRSVDGGTTWSAVASGSNKSIVHAAVLRDGRIVLATQGGEILLGDQAGQSFAQLPLGLAGKELSGFVIGNDGVSFITVGAGGVSRANLDIAIQTSQSNELHR